MQPWLISYTQGNTLQYFIMGSISALLLYLPLHQAKIRYFNLPSFPLLHWKDAYIPLLAQWNRLALHTFPLSPDSQVERCCSCPLTYFSTTNLKRIPCSFCFSKSVKKIICSKCLFFSRTTLMQIIRVFQC